MMNKISLVERQKTKDVHGHDTVETIVHETLDNNRDNQALLFLKRAKLLDEGIDAVVVLGEYSSRPNRAERRWRSKVSKRLLRKVSTTTQQVEAALEEERQRRTGDSLSLPGSQEFEQTKRRMRRVQSR